MTALLLMLVSGVSILYLSPVAACLGYALFWMGLWKLGKARFTVAFLWGACLCSVQMAWLAHPRYHGWFIVLAYGLICLSAGLLWACFCCFVKERQLNPLSLAALWTLIEWGRLYILCGYAWNPVGLCLGSTAWGRQAASLAGVLGLTFLVMLTNLLFLKNRRLWVLAAIAPYAFGFIHLHYHKQKMEEAPLDKAVLVQPHLLPEQKVPMADHLQAFISPLEQWKRAMPSLNKVDWIIFPEAAFPFGAHTPLFSQGQMEVLFKKPRSNHYRWSHLNIAQEIALISGAEVVIGLDDSDETDHFNAAFHLTPQGKITRFEKKQLLPIAETLPFEWLRPLAANYGIEDFFTAGKDKKLVGTLAPFGISICYDECFSDLVRQKGARMHVNVTNDGWYPDSKLNHIHFEHAKLRAIENGIPHLRACNTGITAAIDSLGNVIAKLDASCPGHLIVDVPRYSYTTLFARFGQLPLIVFCIVAATLMFIRHFISGFTSEPKLEVV